MRSFAIAAMALLLVNQPGTRGQTFRSDAEGILVNVSVTRGNRPVEGLRAEDFELTDNGVRQHIQDVTVDTWPIDLTLAVDVSGGGLLQFPQAAHERQAGVGPPLRNLPEGSRGLQIQLRPALHPAECPSGGVARHQCEGYAARAV
jgi:hypothetical protein